MASIKTRVTSGGGATVMNQPLTNAEIDTNFINLNTDKVETADCVSTNTPNKIVKRDASGNFTAGTISASLTGTATQANNINGGVAGAIPWQTAANTTGLTAAGANGQIFRSNGASAPTWIDQSSIAAGTAAVFATARNISIGTGATGTATSFNGSSDITIPITAINADYISSGTLAAARLGTTATPQFGSLGVGQAASGTSGEIRATTFTETSTIVYKERVQSLAGCLGKVLQLRPVSFFWKPDFSEDAKQQVGLIAEEVDQIITEVVSRNPDGTIKGINYTKLVPYLIGSVQQLEKEIKDLRGE